MSMIHGCGADVSPDPILCLMRQLERGMRQSSIPLDCDSSETDRTCPRAMRVDSTVRFPRRDRTELRLWERELVRLAIEFDEAAIQCCSADPKPLGCLSPVAFGF